MITRKKLFVVDTKQKTGGDTHNFSMAYRDCAITQNVHKIQLKSINMANSFYNIINPGRFDYSLNADPVKTFELDPGQYTATQIIALFDTFVATYAGTEVLSVDPITKLFTLTSTGNLLIIYYYNDIYTYTDLARIMGFDNISYTDYAIAINTPNLSGAKDVYIHLSFINNNLVSPSDSRLQSDVFTNIQMSNIPFGSNLVYEGRDLDYVEFQSPTNISMFKCYLTDIEGNILENNGLDWSMNLAVWYNE